MQTRLAGVPLEEVGEKTRKRLCPAQAESLMLENPFESWKTIRAEAATKASSKAHCVRVYTYLHLCIHFTTQQRKLRAKTEANSASELTLQLQTKRLSRSFTCMPCSRRLSKRARHENKISRTSLQRFLALDLLPDLAMQQRTVFGGLMNEARRNSCLLIAAILHDSSFVDVIILLFGRRNIYLSQPMARRYAFEPCTRGTRLWQPWSPRASFSAPWRSKTEDTSLIPDFDVDQHAACHHHITWDTMCCCGLFFLPHERTSLAHGT